VAAKMEESTLRIQRLRREAALVVRFRRFGYTMNSIAAFLGRSTSFVYRILKFQAGLGAHIGDLRKIPCRIRQLAKARLERDIQCFGELWNMWLLGIGEKPP